MKTYIQQRQYFVVVRNSFSSSSFPVSLFICCCCCCCCCFCYYFFFLYSFNSFLLFAPQLKLFCAIDKWTKRNFVYIYIYLYNFFVVFYSGGGLLIGWKLSWLSSFLGFCLSFQSGKIQPKSFPFDFSCPFCSCLFFPVWGKNTLLYIFVGQFAVFAVISYVFKQWIESKAWICIHELIDKSWHSANKTVWFILKRIQVAITRIENNQRQKRRKVMKKCEFFRDFSFGLK